MFLGIPRETGSSEGLTSFISFPLLQSAGFPSRLSRDGSLSQDHTAGSGLTRTPLSQSLHQLFKEQPQVQKQLPLCCCSGKALDAMGPGRWERDLERLTSDTDPPVILGHIACNTAPNSHDSHVLSVLALSLFTDEAVEAWRGSAGCLGVSRRTVRKQGISTPGGPI